MRFRNVMRACCAGAAIVMAATPAQAETVPGAIAVNAENIRKLNIMLMVTSLRCRESAHDFRGEYDLFAQAHGHNLSAAHDHLKRKLAAKHGESESAKALDRMGVTMANSYGEGHPKYGCADLKRATLQLAMSQDTNHLTQMADKLLATGPGRNTDGGWFHQRRMSGQQAPALPYDVRGLDEAKPTPGASDSSSPRSRQIPNWLRG